MFEGEKVILRSLELTDLETIMQFWNNITLRRELGPVVPHSRKEREDWIKSTWVQRRVGEAFIFAIDDLKTKKLVGHCSLKNIRVINRTASASIVIYDEKNRGKGYGTDVMRVLLRIGFDYLNLHRIGLNVFDTNPRAIHVYEKVGFTKVGVMRHTDYVEGKYVNDVAMDILEDEWRAKYKKD